MFTTMRNGGSRWTRSTQTAVVRVIAVLAAMTLPAAAQAQEPFIGEVVCGGWDFCPVGWAECNGQLMAISQNTALFALLQSTYVGGNGMTTFALPNIQGRTLLGVGEGPGLTPKVLGEQGGEEQVTLMPSQMPAHSHGVPAHNGAERAATPRDRLLGQAPASAPVYTAAAPDTAMHPAALGVAGGSQPHNNLQPYLVLKCCIATQGVFPSPN
jgi:microcystin-dependent protein